MHNLLFGISELFKECLYRYLSDPECFSNALIYQSSTPRPFTVITKIILAQPNNISCEKELQNRRYGSRIDFSKDEGGGSLSSLFTDSGILRMLQAVDYGNIDQVPPFFGEIVDTLCRSSETAPITAVFCSYVDLNYCIRRLFSNLGWIVNELMALELLSNNFRTIPEKMFGPY